jgi:hypothetical protein
VGRADEQHGFPWWVLLLVLGTVAIGVLLYLLSA